MSIDFGSDGPPHNGTHGRIKYVVLSDQSDKSGKF